MRNRHRRPLLQVYANFQDPSSIGHVARAVSTYLAVQLGEDCAITCTTGQYPHSVPGSNVRHNPNAEVAMFVGFPRQSEKVLQAHGRVVGVYVCEGDIIPTTWVRQCNQHAAIVVPSNYCRDAFVNSGVEVPVVVVPHGVDHHYQQMSDVAKETAFTFLAVFAMNPYWPRKGVEELLAAWRMFHEAHPRAQLQIKTNPHPDIHHWESLPNVTWITGRYSSLEIVRLYNAAHAHVHASRGEGFGLTPLESLSCGTPVVVPFHTGMLEYVDESRDVRIHTDGTRVDFGTYDNSVGRLFHITAEDVFAGMERCHAEWQVRATKAKAFDPEPWRWHSVLAALPDVVRTAMGAPTNTSIVSTALQPVAEAKARRVPSPKTHSRDLRLYLSPQQAKAYEQDPTGLGEVVRGLAENMPVTDRPDHFILAPYNPEHCNFRELAAHAPVVAYTTFESDRWPEWWVRELNHCCAVVVPQAWVAEALMQSGCRVPIKVVAQGFKQLPRLDKAPRKFTKRSPCTFGFLGVPVRRKNLDLAVRALPPDCKLLVRAAWWPENSKPPADPRVELLGGRMDDATLLDAFWRRIDCLVFPSSGEGYSMVPREAIVAGVPAIVSDIPAHDDLTCCKVATRQGKPAYYEFCNRTVGAWGDVDEADLRDKMQAFADGERWQQECATVTWADAVANVREAVDVKVTTYCPRRDAGGGIDRFASRLVEHWPGLRYTMNEGVLDTMGAAVQWVVLQFEYGLYSLTDLERLAEIKQLRGFKVLSIVHSANTLYPEVDLNAALTSLSDVVVLLNPKQDEAFPTGRYVEHPWPTPAPYVETTAKFVGNHGFIHRQKGYAHVFKAARNAGLPVRIVGKLNRANGHIARTYDEQIAPHVTAEDDLRFEYLPDNELRSLMSECAVLLYCYEPWRNVQASGAVRDAVMFGRPVVVSEHAEYFDMPEDAFPRIRLGDEAQTTRTLRDVLDNSRQWYERQSAHAASHGWQWFALTLRDIMGRLS